LTNQNAPEESDGWLSVNRMMEKVSLMFLRQNWFWFPKHSAIRSHLPEKCILTQAVRESKVLIAIMNKIKDLKQS
jgi:hypothetical protein